MCGLALEELARTLPHRTIGITDQERAWHAGPGRPGRPGRPGISTCTRASDQHSGCRRLRRGDALSLTLSTPPSLTRHRSGNKLMGRRGRAQRSQSAEGEEMPPTTPGQGSGNGKAARHARGGGTARAARQYRPGRGRHVENTIMSALVRAGLVPRSYLLTTRGRTTGLLRTNPVVPVEHGGAAGWSAPTGPCPGCTTPARPDR